MPIAKLFHILVKDHKLAPMVMKPVNGPSPKNFDPSKKCVIHYCEGLHNSLQYQWAWTTIECYKKICASSSFINWSLDGPVGHTV